MAWAVADQKARFTKYGMTAAMVEALEIELIEVRHVFPVDPRGHGHPRRDDPKWVLAAFPAGGCEERQIVVHGHGETAADAVADIRAQIWQGL